MPGGPSFFLATLFASLRASNAIEEFRLRLRPEAVWLHERVDVGSTVLRHDETFGFAYFAWCDSFARFEQDARVEVDRVAASTGALDPQDERDDLVYHSVLPWIRLTGFIHARRRRPLDSIPRIVFGKHFEREGERWLPVCVDAHHALIDGLHVGRWLARFEQELATVATAEPDALPG
jgi:chloramphenicol O-acetyltransferase type A